MAKQTIETRPEDILFSPSDVARLGLANLNHRRVNRDHGVPFGIPSIDKDYLPLLPGELECTIARPGNGKTGVMVHRARQRAKYLASKNSDKAVVFATCEQTVEELWTFGIAAQTGINVSDMARGNINDTEWVRIEQESVGYGAVPIWLIGPSKENRKKRPKITIPALVDAIFHMEETSGTKPDIVFLDYLQLVRPSVRTQSKTVDMSEILEECKDGALHTDCGWSVAVQAKREVDLQALPIPGLDSGQWTSAIEQFSDKVWSLVRPCKYRKPGEQFGSQTVEGHSQMVMSLLKQKLGMDNKAFWVYFDPAYNKLHDLEMDYAVADNANQTYRTNKQLNGKRVGA